MSFDLFKIPFYKAVSLFEQEDYQAAFDIFVDCAMKGNLYAPYYLRGILKANAKKAGNEPNGNAIFLETIEEYIKNIPQEFNPESWYLASCLIIEISKIQTLKQKQNNLQDSQKDAVKIQREVLRIQKELEALYSYAPNAAFALLELCRGRPETLKLVQKVIMTIGKSGDLYSLYYFKQNFEGQFNMHPYMPAELPIIEKQAALTYSTQGGNLERLLSKLYDIKQNQKTNAFKEDPYRKYNWQIVGAHMGNKELQFMFSQPNPINKKSKEDLRCWLFVAAQNGERQAQLLYAMDHLNDVSKRAEQRDFLEKGLKDGLSSYMTPHLYAQALLQYGFMHEKGFGGLEKNETLALEYYRKSDELQCYGASGNIAVYYSKGRGGLAKNYKMAVEFYERAIQLLEKMGPRGEKEIAQFHYDIGALYYTGSSGLTRNYKKAAEHYEKSLKVKLNYSYIDYAIMLAQGLGIEKDIPKAIRFCMEAADKHGSVVGAYEVLGCYVGKDIVEVEKLGITEEKLLQYIERICKEPHPQCREPFSLAGIYYSEKEKPDHEKAFKYFKWGVDHNEAYSLIKMGTIYEHGFQPLSLNWDYEKAYQYYFKAIELFDHPTALNNAACFLLNGYGVPKDVQKARILFEKALAKESLLSAYGLACIYEQGLGVTKDLKRAFEYGKMAETTEDPDVLFFIGLYYHNFPEAVPTDLKLACEYYQRAFKVGNVYAAHNYMTIRIQEVLNTMPWDEMLVLVMDLMEKAEFCMKNGIIKEAVFVAIFHLILDLDATPKAIEVLQQAEAIKPYKRNRQTLEYLLAVEKITLEDIFILLCSKSDPLEKKKQIEETRKAALKLSQAASNPAQKVQSAQSSKSAPEHSSPKKPMYPSETHQNPQKSKEARKSRLRSKIAWFVDPENRKAIDGKEFKRLLGKIAVTEGVITTMSPSKSSNTRFRMEHKNFDTTLCFSYHPTHSSGRGMDAEVDPARARELQGVIKKMGKQLRI